MVYRKCPHLTTDLTTLLTCCCAVPYARERWAHRTSGGGRGGEPECSMNESIFTSEKSKKSKKLQSYPLMDEIWLTSWYSKYPIIYRVLYIPGGAGFLPPNCSFLYTTVSSVMQDCQKKLVIFQVGFPRMNNDHSRRFANSDSSKFNVDISQKICFCSRRYFFKYCTL